ncbi:MAG: CHAT domain-containing protein [Polaromonas sp.]
MTQTQDITFIVPGQLREPQALPATTLSRSAGGTAAPGRVKVSVQVEVQRGAGQEVRVTARPGEDVVLLGIANGPTLVLHPEYARDLMRAQSAGATRSALTTADDAEVRVNAQLGWPGLEAGASRGATRGWMGQGLIGSFDIVTGLATDEAATLASAAITQKVDGQVEAGVYELSSASLPATLKGSGLLRASLPPAGRPMLVLVHGTFVDTVSTYGKLWEQHPQAVQALFTQYGQRVYALDHPTLGLSPIANALNLVRAMPPGARLHLLTHSRGGLVAEVLARACGTPTLGDPDLAWFADPRYAQHRADLQQLQQEARAKGLVVERLLRVACPARGTLLASKRLDAYLSVLKWGLELAGVPVAPLLVDFLYEVARRRADPTELPGLEAMMPDSAVVQWLNSGCDPITGDLRVLAGDIQGDSLGSWLKTLMADAFFWTDNDLVVQTRSMYGGTPRAKTPTGASASFLLDQGGKVSHFTYFSNERTVNAVVAGLSEPAPADFSAIGPLSWAGEDASGSRAALAASRSRGGDATAAASRPAVFVLPGMLGSNLKLDNQRIWLGLRYVNGLERLAWNPATAARVQPDGPVNGVYDELIERLAETHEVIPFAYDWRRPMEDEARRLAAALEVALNARQASRQPVRLLAHSMGGLVARALLLEKPDIWRRLMAHPDARLLMLGTPNAGTWAPMQVLSGDDTFGNALVAFGALFDNSGARNVIAAMPGFIQLQAALLDPTLGLSLEETWKKLADDDIAQLLERNFWHAGNEQLAVYRWGAPPQAVLDQAVALRRRLDQQATALGDYAQKMLLVTGHARLTPNGFNMGPDGLDYLELPAGGDGRVTLASAQLPGVETWQVNAPHGDLPRVASAFDAYIELLQTGSTQLLPRLEASTANARGTDAPAVPQVRSRPSRTPQGSQPPSTPADMFGGRIGEPDSSGATGLAGAGGNVPLSVSVLNGDLKFVHLPVIVGHYRSLVLTGTEYAVNGLVGQAMSQSLSAGLYPDGPGAHQIFVNLIRPDDNPLDLPRPQAVIVAGLGDEGKLRGSDLVHTVCQAILAYAQRVAEQPGDVGQFEMAATLIGSGGTGVSAGAAAQLVAQGAYEANQKLHQGRRPRRKGWPLLSHLTLVEFYLDRASDAWRALQVQSTAAPNQFQVRGPVQQGVGAMRRSLDSSYRGSAYDLISALTGPIRDGEPSIAYTLDTRRARTEVRAQQAQGTLLRELVEKASNDANRDPQIGRTLFNLLVPVEMEPFLGGTSEMLIELDGGTAVIPWELLDTGQQRQSGGDNRPWAIRSKLLRKLQLRSEQFRVQVSDANADDSVLVIGEPLCDPNRYPPLPGARAEAQAVVTQLTGGSAGLEPGKVRALLSGTDDARAIINALFERPYRVVHVAGHGALGADGGVVLSGKTFLGANEVQAMRTVPELVFLNCCHLAGRAVSTTLAPSYNRASFAANIAEALIGVGVRCVIAAGWAVEDGPAETFATTFYQSLLRGERFIDAVNAARTAAWNDNKQGNTWAAYQCYGDPGWTWSRAGPDAQRAPAALDDQFAGVSSPVALTLALENLVVSMRFGGGKPRLQHDKVVFLESRYAALWGDMGVVAEALGQAFAEAQDLDNAIDWYRKALAAPDGGASLKSVEQLGKLLARRGELRPDADADQARQDIQTALTRLQQLSDMQPTTERYNLLGSAWKRAAILACRDGDPQAERQALQQMAAHYGQAEAMEVGRGSGSIYYPALNGMAAELRLAFLEQRPPDLSAGRLARVRDALQTAAAQQPDFWCVAGQSELQLLQALAYGELSRVAAGLGQDLQALKARVPAPQMWSSLYAQARFILQPYLAQAGVASPANTANRQAAESLLQTLQALANPAP